MQPGASGAWTAYNITDRTMSKYKIGIVPAAEDDSVCLMAIASLEEPQMTDLFVPVLYASQERIKRLREGRESDTRFTFIPSAEQAKAECVCVVDSSHAAVAEGEENAAPALPAWQADLQSGVIDALVFVGDADMDTCTTDAKAVVYLSASDCMILVGREHIDEEMERTVKLLERDLDFSRPRMAVVADTDRQKEEWEAKAEELRAFLYGPFLTETFFEEDQQEHYDVLLAFDHVSARRCFREAAHAWGVCLTEDPEGRITLYPAYNTQPMGEDATSFNTLSFNHALYSAVDVLRSRERYDEGHISPLPKLFFERKDERRGGNIE